MPQEALENFLLAEDFEEAARLINELACNTATQQGQWKTVGRWIEALPASLFETSPTIILKYSWVQLVHERFDIAEQYLQKVETLLQTDTPEVLMTPDRLALAGEVAAIAAHITAKRGDSQQAVELAKHALVLLPADGFVIRSIVTWTLAQTQMASGNLVATVEAFKLAETLARKSGSPGTAMLASFRCVEVQLQQGQLRQAVKTCQRALTTKEWQPLPYLGAFATALANILYEWNDLENALTHLNHGIKVLTSTENLYNLLQGYSVLARIKQVQGDLAVQAALEEADQLVSHTDWLDSISLVDGPGCATG